MAEKIKKESKEKKNNEKVKKRSTLSRITGIVKKQKVAPLAEEAKTLDTDPFKTLKFVLMTEKAIRMIELQNKLIFIVDRKANKKEIFAAAESAFQAPIESVNTVIDQKGRKKAFIKFQQEGQAGEIAIRLGII